MLKGYETLEEIEGIIRTLRNEVERIDDNIATLFETSQRNKKEQAKSLKTLAKIRLDALEAGEVEAASGEIEALLGQREEAFARLRTQITQTHARITDLENQRLEAHHALDTAAKAVIDKEHEIQAQLEHENDYQAQLSRTKKAASVLKAAEKKAKEAEESYRQKAIPYEQNALFFYLWKRGYGTAKYRHWGLVKMLDGWVADLVNYRKHRLDYWRLTEIPKRLRTHADNAQKQYDKELEILASEERKYAQKKGLPPLQEEERHRQEIVDSIDDEIEREEKVYEGLLKQRRLYAEDRDTDAQKAIALINQTLEHQNLSVLTRLSKQTRTTDDDEIVSQLVTLRSSQTQTEEKIARLREQYNQKITQLEETEALRNRFKRSRYDDIRSGFDNADQIGDMLGGILGGVLQSEVLWDTLQRSQRHIDTGSWPDFGSGGFSPANSPWHFPNSREGGSGFGLPDIGGGFSSRNPIDTGFSTGGGF